MRLRIALPFFFLTAVMAMAQDAPRPGRKSAVCPRSKFPVTIDGKLDDWKDVDGNQGIVIGEADRIHKSQHYRGPEDACAILYLKWDDEKLYVAAVVTDDIVRNTNSGPINNQNGDGILICFAPTIPPGNQAKRVDYTYSYILTPGDFGDVKPQMQIVKGDKKTTCERAARRTKHGYQLEAAFPLALLPELRPEPGRTVGFEACQYEGDRIALPTLRTEILAWNSTKDRMDASECGKLTFTGPLQQGPATSPGEVYAEVMIQKPFKPTGPYAARKITESFATRGVPLSLYFDRAERDEILDRAGDKRFPVRRMLERMLVVCDSYLETWKPKRYEMKSLTVANAEQVSKVVHRLGLAFVLTEEAVYADLARRTLLQMAETVGNWSGDLTDDQKVQVAATLSHALAVGYDWVFNALNDEERKTLLNAMVEAGARLEAAGKGRWALAVLGIATRKHNEKADAWMKLGEDAVRNLAKSGWGKTADEIENALWRFLLVAEPLKRTAGRDLYLEIGLAEPASRLMTLRRTKVADGWAIDPLRICLGTNTKAALALKIAGEFANPNSMWFYGVCFQEFPTSSNGPDDVYSILWFDRRVKPEAPDWFNEKSQALLLKELKERVVAEERSDALERSKARMAPKRKTVQEQITQPVPFSAEWLKTVDEKVLDDFQVTVKPELLKVHPRLYYTADDLPLLHARAESTHQRPWRAFMDLMKKSVTRKYRSLRELSKSSTPTGRGTGDRTATYGIAYGLTGDDAFAELVKRHILGMCGEFPWEANRTDLVHGHALAGLGIAYDCAYPYLMPEEKVLVRDTLIKQAGIMADGFGYLLRGKTGAEKKKLAEELKKIYADPRRGGTARKWRRPASANNHSWIQKTGLAIAATAILDECPDAKEWLKRVRWEYEKVLQIHGPDGASCEGGGMYWSYGLQWMLKYLELLYHTSGEDLYDSAWLENTGYYRLYIMTPDRAHVVNFGDNPTTVGRRGFLEYRLASEFREEYVQWLGETLTYEEGIIGPPGAPFWNLFWYDPSLDPKAPDTLRPYRYFNDLEMATMRTDWGKDATMVAFRCGPPGGYSVHRHGAGGYGHAQPDQNHFMLFSGGEFLLSDPGYSRWKLTREHNTILVDGYGQVGEQEHWFHRKLDEDQFGRIEEFFGSKTYCYVRGNAAPAYHYKKNDPNKRGNVEEPEDLDLTKYLRHLLFVGGKYLVTFDEIETASPRRIDWLLHSESPFEVGGEREFTAKQGDMRLAVKVVEPDRIEYKTGPMMVRVSVKWKPDGKVDYSEVPSQKGYVLDLWPANKTTSVYFLAAYYPYKAGEVGSVPVIRKISGDGWVGITVASETVTDRVIFNTSGGGVKADGIATDAARCVVGTDVEGKVKRFVLHSGTVLKVGDRVFAQLGRPAVVVSDGRRTEIRCNEAMAAEVFVPQRPTTVFLNDKEREIVYNGNTNLLRVQLQEGDNKLEVEF
ncbi:MAG: hypothetical protein GXP25_08005 [Planctomycetes bacterium]|nr:hypothetical protein [Planctomycetota bacterium]